MPLGCRFGPVRQGIGTVLLGAVAAALVLGVAFYSVAGKRGSDATYSQDVPAPR